MNPAFSVIFLTTLIGVGQGFFISLYAAELLAQADIVAVSQGDGFYVAGSAIALLFLLAGLAASFLHLGHPERAWRAAAMWRTSWLSREVIVLPALMLVIFIYGVIHYLGANAAGSGSGMGRRSSPAASL